MELTRRDAFDRGMRGLKAAVPSSITNINIELMPIGLENGRESLSQCIMENALRARGTQKKNAGNWHRQASLPHWKYNKERRKFYEKKAVAVFMAAVMVVVLAGCGGNNAKETGDRDKKASEESKKDDADETEIQVFIAASLNTVMTEIAEKYNKTIRM